MAIKLIQNNPYRTLGLLAGASAREITRQTNNLKKYIAAGAEPPSDYSFATLDRFRRTAEDIDAATAKLNLDEDKMLASLFWFWKGNDITDEPTFDALKEGYVETAYQIWDKLIKATEQNKKFENNVTARNASAFHNQAVLVLLKNSVGSYVSAVMTNIKFIESECFSEFVQATVDVTYKVSKKDIELRFLEVILNEINDRKTSVSLSRLVKYLNNYDFTAKTDFLKSISQKFTAKITAQIETARKTRTDNKQNAATAGENLYKNTQNDLLQLKNIFGAQDFSYSNVADKVANELLQCGIDYFNHYRDSSLDPGDNTMSVFMNAKTVAVGNIVKQRCDENIETVQEWISDKPKRDKQNKIEADFTALSKIFADFENRSDTISNAKLLINQSKPILDRIKTILGNSDKLYLKLSTQVAAMAQHMIIEEVNKAQENLQSKLSYDRYNTMTKLETVFKDAWAISVSIGNLDMEADFRRNKYNTNRETLKGLIDNLQKWIGNKPGRDKQKNIEKELNQIQDLITSYQSKVKENDRWNDRIFMIKNYHSVDFDNIKTFLLQSQPLLERIKDILGRNDDLYIQLSSTVVSIAQNDVVLAVNAAQSIINHNRFATDDDLNKLKEVVKKAWDITNLLKEFSVNDVQKDNYVKNRKVLKKIYDKLELSLSGRIQNSIERDPVGCFIWIIIIVACILLSVK